MNLHRLFLFVIVIHLGFHLSAFAYEVDNFTDRYKPLKDSRDVLNNQVNSKLMSRLKEANIGRKCDPKELHKLMYESVSGSVVGSLEDWADKSPAIEKHQPRESNNIYSKRGKVSKAQGFALSAAGMNSSINLHGQYVGVDKLGHFFDQGKSYYDIYVKESDPAQGIKKALRSGKNEETGIYGQLTSGIASSADLATNFSGLHFWMSLSSGPKPYFQCQNNQWVQVRDFDFADYVTAAWDEGINCSDYTMPSAREGVAEQQKILEKSNATDTTKYRFTCPISPRTCIRLKKQYGENAASLLGVKCLNAKRISDEGKISGQVSARELGKSKYDEMPITLKPTKSSTPEKSESKSKAGRR